MIAETTGQPLSSVSEFDAMRWGLYWKHNPPMLKQCRDILAQVAAMVGQGLGAKDIKPSDFIPTEAQETKTTPISEDVLAYFKRIGADIKYE